jgi:hypothetical protein
MLWVKMFKNGCGDYTSGNVFLYGQFYNELDLWPIFGNTLHHKSEITIVISVEICFTPELPSYL